MTDAELRDLAVAELKATTISYPTWLDRVENGYKGKPYPPEKTSWGRAFDYLAQIGSEPEPEPGPGVAIANFADVVDARGWGKYVNRWDRRGQNAYHGDEVTGPPWPSIGGASITEVAGGFRFRCNGEMVAFSPGSKAIMLHDQDHYIPPSLSPPYEFDWSAEYVFPQAGNPNGWAPLYDVNALLEFVGDSFVANQFGVDGPRNCLYMRTYDAPTNRTRVHRATSYPIRFDTPIRVRCHWRFSYGADGFARFWVDGNEIGTFTGQTMESGKRYQSFMFGYYSSTSPDRNEIVVRDIRLDVG